MATALETLQQTFGYSSFREGQAEIIDAVMAGQRTLGIMPTGGGKSLTYQIPALMLDGITVVISPLLSLMKNQVDELHEAGVPAVTLNSTQNDEEYRAAMNSLLNEEAKLLYLAPERLGSEGTYALLNRLPISLVVIDEVHVLSQWGHDFRPSYLNAVGLINNLESAPRVMALTATATERVQADLEAMLHIQHTVRTSVVRDNLTIRIEKGLNKRSKEDFITKYIREHRGESGIVYAPTRKIVEALTETLTAAGINAVGYHAGMPDQARAQAQDDFIYDRRDVVVATNAFGMGINKSNVRFVIHYGIPGSVEAYYQEIGRAGRDGLPSEAILLYAAADLQTQRFFIDNSDNQTPEYQNLQKMKLQEMANYGATQMCLQRYITRYFGEDTPDCGRCTNCLDNRDAVDITTDAQKVLSHVVRMAKSRGGENGFGKTLTAETLRGKLPDKFQWTNLDQLPTFGLLQGTARVHIMSLIDYLIAEGYLRVTGQYAGLTVSPEGVSVLKGERQVKRRQDVRSIDDRVKAGSPSTRDDLDEAQRTVFEALRTWRLELARVTEIPPFIIFNDRTLVELAKQQPRNNAELMAVPGIGDAKAERYGKEVLAVIAKATETE
ncbi:MULTISPECIES: DNA helicase RecQ [Weissella]|uniref:DNA helicase RecQ n=1 Tax=Weissella TaxID=46255 RepID=UPI0002192AD4|nr:MULTISPECIES: DNA helicase RecQ [Weissella]APS26943.1 ATP-dependent DNA helicase RecQ [Weissella cibaria]APU62340.1 ATP-dependent DNA helicase RecQ [Weissella cibaria]APU64492.1 ATP-dependent DNA helicase RecQ [Weissella cibaria]ASS52128.1 ATP-dependent DNA helicase RecQ [Weissella cibaria]KXU09866.1 ATP-dependent DNA helicase RecQ [Weissella sp. DD23]